MFKTTPWIAQGLVAPESFAAAAVTGALCAFIAVGRAAIGAP